MESKKEQHIYEVTAEVDNSIINEWENWIAEHVREIVALDDGNIFSKGVINKLNNSLLGQEEKSTTSTYVIQYTSVNETSITTYIQKHAPNLRKGAASFGDKLKTSRRLLVEFKTISNPPQTKNFGYVF
ncbi:hypothetical protein RB653_008365 [Dictyostelium firmibasis]|uniref:DUF4286 family protein n=1 Tax=Dictyostelium firmibasis TaxID=79012 RepID=A0AAN7YWJ4_9MYCE